ncbi:MAG: non-specific protein-tyrosine kinase [Thermocaproicibacter melissae]|jgi:capsular exopolysaccharide synthesis family protein|uniref:CpsD/CapB family tyrosine-protein kinase n=1 Tax=Thermocaproicibacter melissae TaxID=2966552 RepID=UPI003A0FE8B6
MQKHQTRTSVLNMQMDPDMKFKVSEAYKMARTNLAFSLVKKGCKKIAFTSPFVGEGKSMTSVNIAITLAQQVNTKVLLIDCDLRKPKVNRFFHLQTSPGLTSYLGGMKDMESIIRHTDDPNLDLITSGVIVPNPSELLAGNEMKKLIEEMESKYDYIIFDTPPVNVVVDALSLAGFADGYVIVVKEGSTLKPELRHAVITLEHAKVKILGIILNGSRLEEKEEYKYRYERYE